VGSSCFEGHSFRALIRFISSLRFERGPKIVKKILTHLGRLTESGPIIDMATKKPPPSAADCYGGWTKYAKKEDYFL